MELDQSNKPLLPLAYLIKKQHRFVFGLMLQLQLGYKMSNQEGDSDCGCGGSPKVKHKDTSITSLMQSPVPTSIKAVRTPRTIPGSDLYDPFVTDSRTVGSFRRSAVAGYDSD